MAQDDLGDGCTTTEEAQAMEGCLYRETSSREAARAIMKSIYAAIHHNEDPARLWEFLKAALMELSYQYTESLITLLAEIEKLPEFKLPTIEKNKRSDGEERLSNLLGFGHIWAEATHWG